MLNHQKKTILLTLTGRDHPGITAEITRILAQHRVGILDITQAVIQKILTLSLLFELNNGKEKELRELLKDLLLAANQMGLKLEFLENNSTDLNPNSKPQLSHYAVTLIAESVTAQALHEVSRTLAHWKFNIDTIKRLSEDEFSCVEMLVSCGDLIDARTLRKELLILAKEQEVDIALQAEGLYRRAKRLIVLDIDSTLIQSEVIDELAREKGVYDQVSQITHEAMMGKMNYDESLKLRCELLKGLSIQDLEIVYQKVQITPGAEDLICVLKKLGYKIAVISGGFSFVANRLKEKLGIDYAFANSLELENGILTGRVIPPIVNAQRKADLLDEIAQQERIDLDQVIAVGDGANDLLMLEKAGLGIAFHAKPVVREKADLVFNQKNMKSILYLLGLSAKDVAVAISDA